MERDQQLQFDKTIEKIHMELVDRAGSNVQGGGIYERIRLWINPRIELHIPFEQIPNEKKEPHLPSLKDFHPPFQHFCLNK